jgi:hypothetical protein
MKLRTTYLLSAFALLAPTLAQAQSCDPAASLLGFEIRAVDTRDVVVNTSYSMRELDRRSHKLGGGKLLGQTDAQFGARLISEDVGCGRKVVVLELQLVKQTVHVASDLPRDSCTFIQTQEHEMEHVEINRRVLADVQREFSNRMDATRFATDAELKVAVMSEVVPGVYKRFTESGRLHSLFDEKDHNADRSQECRRDLAMRTM